MLREYDSDTSVTYFLARILDIEHLFGNTQMVQKTFDEIGIPLSDVTFCVIDFETTGGSAELDRITEIGAAKYRGGECIGTFQTLVNPGCGIPPFITILTGITEAMVMPAPRIEALLGTLRDFIGDSVIVAHNARFDLGFLNAAMIRDDRDPLTNKVIDTVPLARRLVRSEVRDCKLGTLAAHFRFPHQPSHRALDDVLATGDLLHLLIERASGFGVMGLDDLIGLPKLGTHPQSNKLRLTEDLPRSPGVYIFSDVKGQVLYVGKATNVRQRVRSYFSTTETRRKIGPLLRQVHGVDHIATPDALTAGVLEMRLIQRLTPQYNRVGTTSDKYCYVRLTLDEDWPRLVISKNPAKKGIHIGPLTSRSAARLVIEAIESVVPLRRCTARMGRTYTPPSDAPVCSAARLGVAMCPCSGTADRSHYGTIVDFISSSLTTSPAALFALLHERLTALAIAQRFEEAALMRDRTQALVQALNRQRRCDQLRDAGSLSLQHSDVHYDIDCGVLIGTRLDGQLFSPLTVTGNKVLDSLAPLLQPHQSSESCSGPLERHLFDEVMCIARFLEDENMHPALSSCSGQWASPIQAVPELHRLDLHTAA